MKKYYYLPFLVFCILIGCSRGPSDKVALDFIKKERSKSDLRYKNFHSEYKWDFEIIGKRKIAEGTYKILYRELLSKKSGDKVSFKELDKISGFAISRGWLRDLANNTAEDEIFLEKYGKEWRVSHDY